MKPPQPTDRIPWQKAALALVGAAVAAWGAGFVIGLFVRFAFGV